MVKKALLIGINYNECDPSVKLKGCIEDVSNIKNMLVNDLGFQESHINVMTDHSGSTNKPTGMNILQTLNLFVADSVNCSEIWIHYSGHGSQMADNNNEELDSKDEIIIPCDYTTVGVINDDTLRFYINQMKCKVFMVMDCCNSGTNIDLPHHYEYTAVDASPIYSNENQYECENKTIYKISGCKDTQSSYSLWDFETYRYRGACTHSLIDTLKKYNYDISYGVLLNEMNVWMKQNMSDQNPTFSSTDKDCLDINFSATISNSYTPVKTNEELMREQINTLTQQVEYYKALYHNTTQESKMNIDTIIKEKDHHINMYNDYKREILKMLHNKYIV